MVEIYFCIVVTGGRVEWVLTWARAGEGVVSLKGWQAEEPVFMLSCWASTLLAKLLHYTGNISFIYLSMSSMVFS
jgi:hypothetical protein